MTIYLAFSDESGEYKPGSDQSERFSINTPFYVRSTIVFPATSWRTIFQRVNKAKARIGVDKNKEVKWQHVWSVIQSKRLGQSISPRKAHYYLFDCSETSLKSFLEEVFSALVEIEGVFAICTVTDNRDRRNVNQKDMMEWHLQDTMQRIQMDVRKVPGSLCLPFFDPVSKDKDKLQSEIFYDMKHEGDFLKYHNIIDTLNFSPSHHSVGIQLADMVAGSWICTLKRQRESAYLFNRYVKPILRKNGPGRYLGYGVREVPHSSEKREQVKLDVQRAIEDAAFWD